MRRRNLAIGSLLLLAMVVLAGTAARTLAARRLRSDLGVARHEMEQGLFGLAGQRLARLAEQWPDDAEVALQLGRCELARDHPEEALAAWAQAPSEGPWRVPSRWSVPACCSGSGDSPRPSNSSPRCSAGRIPRLRVSGTCW